MDVKRGVTATCERVFTASGNRFENLKVLWGGKTACINYSKDSLGAVRATIVLPNIDESKPVPQTQFNNAIGFVLHELGHAWFTTNKPWDDAVKEHKDGKYIGSMINGLEDPRIEQCVINSGYAPNSAPLFNALINSMIAKNGYPKELTKQSLPFILCIEGRRLNGYTISAPDLVSTSIYAHEINRALQLAKNAKSTREVVTIAENLYDELFPVVEEGESEEGDQPTEAHQPSDEPSEGGEPTEGGGEPDGEGEPDDGDKGDKGEPTKGGKGDSEKPSDPPKEPLKDDGTAPLDVEPNEFIKRSMRDFDCRADRRGYGRPTIKSIEVIEINDWS
jgi:hypothetical protein